MSADREQEKENQSNHSDKPMEKPPPINPPDEKHCNSDDFSTTRVKEKDVTSSNEIDTAERERRKKIRTLFDSLHAMLPHVPPQADKVTVVDETLNYIRTLEQTLKNLQKKKMKRLQSSVSNVGNPCGTSKEAFTAEQAASSSSTTSPSSPHNCKPPVSFQTWTSPNLVVNICGQDAQFSVCSAKNRCPLTTICFVLEKYKIEVLSAHISCDNDRRFYMFQAQLQANRDSDQLPGASSAEETFKQAAAEIILSLS